MKGCVMNVEMISDEKAMLTLAGQYEKRMYVCMFIYLMLFFSGVFLADITTIILLIAIGLAALFALYGISAYALTMTFRIIEIKAILSRQGPEGGVK
jgi:hypothetical protein